MNVSSTPSMIRQNWIEQASVGFPKGMHGGKKAIGQCWSMKASSDGYFELFTSPELGHDGKPKPGNKGTRDQLETIAHELAHATVGTEAGHKGMFKLCAEAIGFIGPMTSTPAGPKMADCITRIIEKIGEFPAGALNVNDRKKQGTRLIKCECMECGYTVRTTKKWIEASGAPICPQDMDVMACDAIEGEDE
jgi:hypothetical protein